MSELIVFDFDYTIAKTIEHVWVWSPRGNFIYNNKTYRKAHPTQLQQSGILDDEEINNDSFQEFYNLNIIKTKIIPPLLPYIIYYSNKQKIHILTARPQSIERDVFLFLQNHQINTNNIQFTGLTNSDTQKKIEWINNQILTQNFKKLILFEDNIKLINYMLEKCVINKSLYYINNYTNKTVITYYE